jgi:hypothetical protein
MDTRFYKLGVGYSAIPLAPGATTALPTKPHITPGQYIYEGVGYDCTAAGLYRWADPVAEVIIQRISLDPNPATADIPTYMASLAWAHADGCDDGSNAGTLMPLSGANLTTILNILTTRLVKMQCGFIADFARNMLSQYSPPVPARLVQMTEGVVPTNIDTGHIVMEEKSSGAWRLWDLTNGIYFTDASGNHLDLDQLITLGVANATMVRIAEKRNSRDLNKTNGFEYGLWEEFWGLTDANVLAWCERIYQIPAVYSGGTWYAYVPTALASREPYIAGLGFTVQTQAAWQAEWYPAG